MAETTLVVVNTLYADADNDPPGSDQIAYPNVLHGRTGGTGTYVDPITFAADPLDFPPGTRIYVPDLFRYHIMEDLCAQSVADRKAGKPTKIDLFAGGKGQPSSVMDPYEAALTKSNRTIIVNPDPGKLVIVGPLWETKTKTSGNTGAVPDTSTGGGTPPPPQEDDVSVRVPLIYGAGGDPWVRRDDCIEIKGGAIRVFKLPGVDWPSSEIVLPATAGKAYKVSVNLLDEAWIKVTNGGATPVFEDSGRVGVVTFQFTANNPSMSFWIGPGYSALGSARFQDIVVAPA